MADHKVQRPSPGKPLTRRQKDTNIAINRAGIDQAIAAESPAPRESTASLIRGRAASIDATVAAATGETDRLKGNQSTDSDN